VPHAVDVATSWAEDTAQPAGVTLEVFAAAACFALSAGAVAGTGNLHQDPPTVMLLLGWPAFALAGGVVLDRRPGARVARQMVALGLVPLVDIVWAAVDAAGMPTAADINGAAAALSGLQLVAVAIGIPWTMRGGLSSPLARLGAVLAVVGAVTVLFGLRGVGLSVVVAAIAGVYLLIGHEVRTESRESRRRTTWVILVLLVCGTATGLGWALAPDVADFVTCGALWVTALATARLFFASEFRPLDEHALDLAMVLAAVAAAALVGGLVMLGSTWTRLPSPGTSASFSALVTLAMAVPAALWVRRSILSRRYGNGTISPSDVAMITADLHAQTEPRDLLGKAARMVATASGSREARIVLGDEEPVLPENWVLHPLLVGGDQVGALLVEYGNNEGPELRQQRVVAQLLPTVALVARAVGLAVEAEHARRDVARERDAERTRILGDLHDGLGPVLAGMSMRVQATLRTTRDADHAELLTDLSADLARSRTDLRRLVAGITPSVLDDGDLGSALDRLVHSFRSTTGGPALDLDVQLSVALPSEVQVAVYRSVAEGVTNALRHARASRIGVSVRTTHDEVLVDVFDDGAGGPVVPGVGLSSLAKRAESLGGCIEVFAGGPRGTRLQLRLPTRPGVST
jgi:signal transduction histidine kinase